PMVAWPIGDMVAWPMPPPRPPKPRADASVEPRAQAPRTATAARARIEERVSIVFSVVEMLNIRIPVPPDRDARLEHLSRQVPRRFSAGRRFVVDVELRKLVKRRRECVW